MKIKVLLTVFFLLSLFTYSQQKLKFTYDSAGNQIIRDRVCITCLKAYMPPVVDSLDNYSFEPEPVLSKNFGVTVFPNPVSNILYAEWQPNASRLPIYLLLFSTDGRLLSKYIPEKGQIQVEIDFTRFPPGIYILEAVFDNGEQRSFKVIRNKP